MQNDPQRVLAAMRRSPLSAEVNAAQPDYTPWIGDYNVAHHPDLLSCGPADGQRLRQCEQERRSNRLGAGAPGMRRRRYRPGQPRFRSVCLRSLLLAVEWAERD